jgi:CheY-like chemotaxis protein
MISSVLSTSSFLPYLVISVIGHPVKLLTKGVSTKKATTRRLRNGTYNNWSIETVKRDLRTMISSQEKGAAVEAKWAYFKKRVLLIDDEEHFCYFVKAHLEQTGRFEVLIAGNGLDGIRLAKLNTPDLILLDINMPVMDGPATAERILDDEQICDIPLLFLSALITKDEIEARGGSIAGREFIAKPVNCDELIAAIESRLSPNRGE